MKQESTFARITSQHSNLAFVENTVTRKHDTSYLSGCRDAAGTKKHRITLEIILCYTVFLLLKLIW